MAADPHSSLEAPKRKAIGKPQRSREDAWHSSIVQADAMISGPENQTSLVERIERALLLLALFIELDGDVHVPMYEKCEAELEELKKTQDTKQRARRLLSAYSRSGDVKAIGSQNLS